MRLRTLEPARSRAIISFAVGLASGAVSEMGAEPLLTPASQVLPARAMGGYGRLPLHFEPLHDRTGQASYVARGPGYSMLIGPTEVVVLLRQGTRPARKASPSRGVEDASLTRTARLRVRLAGARSKGPLEALEEQSGKVNYLVGDDRRRWRRNVPTYAKVRSREVYPHIDVVYRGAGSQLEYDFVVAPGGDPNRIRLRFEGGEGLRLDREGNLVVVFRDGNVIQHRPVVYQESGATKLPRSGRWVLRGKNEAGFEIGSYDRSRALVVDPVLSYSTYLGGSNAGDFIGGITVDDAGSAYVTGHTTSTDFPTKDAFQLFQSDSDAFVTKLTPDGSSLVYSTYLGGSWADQAADIAVDASGNAYVAGYTTSGDFPTKNAFQPTGPDHAIDAFVTKLAPDGSSLVYSTRLNGTDGGDYCQGIAVDASGSAYVVGSTDSTDFPTSAPIQATVRGTDAFVTKLTPSGNALVYSTYLGSSATDYGRGVAIDASGSAYIAGETDGADFPTQAPYQANQAGVDGFVAKLSPAGDALLFSTYLGGDFADRAKSIAVDGAGSVYVTGDTVSTNFPTLNAYQVQKKPGAGLHAFVTKFSDAGNTLVYSTYLGGSISDRASAIAVDGWGSAYVTGIADSPDFPVRNSLQPPDPFDAQAFVTMFSPGGNSLVYSTFLGGTGGDGGQAIAVDGSRNAYVAGGTNSTDFPVRNAVQGSIKGTSDAFVAKIGQPPAALFTLPPCRLLDTRDAPSPYGGPALAAGTVRPFVLAGRCGIPSTAQAVSVNVTVTGAVAAGHLLLHPAGAVPPLASSVNYDVAQTRANNGVVPLSADGVIAIRCSQAVGTAHVILDVNGYFE